MKKLTAFFVMTALAGSALAGPVPKEHLTLSEVARLTRTQNQSQKALQVQAGHWTDDYGVAVVAGVIAVAALTLGIIAIAD